MIFHFFSNLFAPRFHNEVVVFFFSDWQKLKTVQQPVNDEFMENIVVLTEEQLDEKICNAIERALQQFTSTMNPTVSDAGEKLLTRNDLRKRWGVSLGTLHNLMNRGLITPVRLGRRVLFPMNEILRAEADGLNKFRR